MKILIKALITFMLISPIVLAENSFSLQALIKEVNTILPKDKKTVSEDQSKRSAFAAYSVGETNYQFTLSNDTEVQSMPEDTFQVKGYNCVFFRPMGDESGGLFINLKNGGSLAIMIMNGMFSDKEVSSNDLKKLAEKINLANLEL